MDSILQAMLAHQFQYAHEDPNSLDILEKRVKSYARNRQLITYSQLVEGVVFHFASIKKGAPYVIDVQNWIGLDRQIIGEYLGFISTRSYEANRFMLSALVVNKSEAKPSEHFFEWMRYLHVIPNLNEQTALAFWAKQVSDIHLYYSKH